LFEKRLIYSCFVFACVPTKSADGKKEERTVMFGFFSHLDRFWESADVVLEATSIENQQEWKAY